MIDDKGVSLVLTNTAKGEECFRKISPSLFVQRRSLSEAIKYNPKLTLSSEQPQKREQFFVEFAKELPFDNLIRRYMKNTGLKAEIKKTLKSILGEEFIKKLRK